MRLYYETLFAWKKFQPNEENVIPIDKLKKVVEKLKTWGHLYLVGWDVEKMVEEFCVDGAFSLKQLIKFVFSVATRFEYNKERVDTRNEHVQQEDKSLTTGSVSEHDRSEKM
jgi:hypothetical protein